MYFVPTVGAYELCDDWIYYTMLNDVNRNKIYEKTLKELVKNKIVVDIGTGKDIILSRLCIESGAKKVYAIEKNAKAYQLANTYIENQKLSDKITLIYGDATTVNLPELVDICVSELLGVIGSCEGVAVILNDARRFLKPDGIMIPYKSITQIAAVNLPQEIIRSRFSKSSWGYAKKVFEKVGYPFDLRVCIKKFPLSGFISNVGIFENLDFTHSLPTEYSQTINLTINQDAQFDGFLLWLKLYTTPSDFIDVIDDNTSNWLPVYFPIFYPGIDVSAGDKIEAICQSNLSDDQINPNYKITGRLLRKNGQITEFEYESNHHKKQFRNNPFYQNLLNTDMLMY
jgi:predicted RNA methylase